MDSIAPQKKQTQASATKEITLNSYIQTEVAALLDLQTIDAKTLEDFAKFVIENHKRKEPKPAKSAKPKQAKPAKPKPLTLTQLKAAVFNHFKVGDLKTLKALENFQMATSTLGKLDFSKKTGWEIIYRNFIGILPEEVNEGGEGCINGINIFKYSMPWIVFNLDPKTATTEDIKSAYRTLSKIYHPDIPNTGNAEIFDRLTTFYNSLTEKF
jgi:DnaJ domain